MRFLCGIFTALVIATVPSLAESEDVTIPNGVVFPFEIKGGKITGAGENWITERTRTARFVMVGEAHGLADVPVFTSALYQQTGRNALAIEVDPWTAARLEKLAAGGLGKMRAHFDQASNYYAVPYYSWAEEAALLTTIMGKKGGLTPRVWGLDQVFITAGHTVVDAITPLLQTDLAHDALAQFDLAVDDKQSVLGVAKPEEMQKLAAVLAQEASPEVKRAGAALQISNEIYGPFARRQGHVLRANEKRERLMKLEFGRYYTDAVRAGDDPKVLMKFGANHLFRGISPVGVAGLGGYADAVAVMRNENTVSFSVLCGPGSKARLYNRQVTDCSKGFAEAFPGLAEFTKALDGNFMIDTRALILSGVVTKIQFSPIVREHIKNFDVLVIIRDSQPATLFPMTNEDVTLEEIMGSQGTKGAE